MSLAERVRIAQSRVDQQTGEARAIAAAGIAARARVKELTEQAELHEQVVKYLTQLGEKEQQHAQAQIEQLVTRGLQVIFDETLSFHLVQSVKNNQASVEFVVRSYYDTTDTEAGQHAGAPAIMDTPLMDARGGGLVDSVSFMLRLVVLLLTPGTRHVLIMDEPFSHVSAEYEPRLAEFLREVADKAKVQIFMVTHSSAYDDVADKRYRLALGPGGSTVASEL